MKEVFHKIMALFMATIVVFSTMSFTINMHYCGDDLVDIGIFKQAKTCGMEMNESTPLSDSTFSKKGCCTDKHITVQGQDELNLSFDNLTLQQQQFVATFAYTYVNLFEGYTENKTAFSEYPPPIIVKSIYKLDETYLI
ncbi:HYC_CC_PP family protein [Yeosuana aromativorans]|uniref:HYC_CC_PP family protein n=1 Tax=Yeosuana aromativorans TaxID=288019 RepID=UPI00166445D2